MRTLSTWVDYGSIVLAAERSLLQKFFQWALIDETRSYFSQLSPEVLTCHNLQSDHGVFAVQLEQISISGALRMRQKFNRLLRNVLPACKGLLCDLVGHFAWVQQTLNQKNQKGPKFKYIGCLPLLFRRPIFPYLQVWPHFSAISSNARGRQVRTY